MSTPGATKHIENEREILSKLETAFKEFIKTRLGSIPNWWRQRVPPETRVTVENRWRREDRIEDIVDYLTLGDCMEIFLYKENWSEIFQQVFGDKDTFVARLKEIIVIRNKTAHSLKVTREERAKLKHYRNELIRKMSG